MKVHKSGPEHFQHSSLREKVLEHVFVGDLLRSLWLNRVYDVEIARPEVDNSGADLLVVRGGLVRHVQLKSSFAGARTASQKIHLALGRKPSGCVIWSLFDQDSLSIEAFLWFGAKPGKPLPDITRYPTARHTKANSQGEKLERPNIRVVKKGDFTPVGTLDEIVERLVGI